MSYARKAVGSVNSIAHGPAGTCSKLIIARFCSAINPCRHHWAEPLCDMETCTDYPSPMDNHEDPRKNSDPLATGLDSGSSSTLNKQSRSHLYSFIGIGGIVTLQAHTGSGKGHCPLEARFNRPIRRNQQPAPLPSCRSPAHS